MKNILAKTHALLSWFIKIINNARRVPHRNDSNSGDSATSVAAVSPAIECYACTQPGVPTFHSTTCDRAHSPEWAASAGSSLIPIQPNASSGNLLPIKPKERKKRKRGQWVLDPRSPRVQHWNRGLLLARAVALALDPIFFYSLSVGGGNAPACLYMDGNLVAAVAVMRTMADLAHIAHMLLQLRLAYVSRESLVVGCGKLVWDARMVAEHYLRSVKGFWFDLFVILPVPQVAFFMVIPKLIQDQDIKLIMTILLLIFFFQFLPKVFHIFCVMRRMQKVTGFIFGSIWWGFGLNLIAYFIASHVAGGCWYVLTIQRIASCLKQQCEKNSSCNLRPPACLDQVCYHLPLSSSCQNLTAAADMICLKLKGPFRYGIYGTALPIVSSNSLAVKILYPIFWGLMTLSTFGNNLEPTSHWMEVIFSITIVLSGLMLFTLLIGNIQVFLHSVMARKRKMQLRCRDMEWWMRRRQLPSQLRQRVRQYELQNWAGARGEDEKEMIKDLPEGLRRDIKRHLYLDLIKQAPLFQKLDDLILDNICDRVEPIVFSKNEKVIREGDPVKRMVFVIKGALQSRQKLSKGMVASCNLGPGGFFGDELLSWCLRRPFLDRMPASSATFICTEPTEALALEAAHLRYITEHFRYKFADEKLKRTARFYSANWRTWAAINIQLAWHRHRARTGGAPASIEPSDIGDDERRLRRYAAMFMSIKPHDHLE